MRRFALVLTLVAGCSSSSSAPQVETLPDLPLEAKPDNGYQVILPIVRGLVPGADNEFCTWTSLIADHDIDVRAVQGFQTIGGHHVILFSTTKHEAPGTTRVCTDDDMSTFRFSAASGAEGQGGKNEAPGNLVYRVPAGAQIVMNHHYINATTKARDAQSAMNIFVADPGKQYVQSGSIAIVDTALRVPAGKSSMDINCTMPRSFDAWYLIPHMHEWGTRITIERTAAAGTAAESLFDVEWTPAYMFHPPELRRDPTAPLTFAAGDKLHVHCEYDNTKSTDLTFGLEMCVAFAQFVDASEQGNLVCDAGHWGTF
ncbi:MAG: hypothetical protein JWN44_6533 [Myxococcales bacterium]|nr:hypothetical protein [Myxococcales bacterium]